MLQSIRDRSQGLVVGVIVGLISLTFVLVGIQSYLEGGSKVAVAEVDGHEIHLAEFQQNLQRFRQRAQSIMGDSFDPLDWDKPEIKQRVMDELIDNHIMTEFASNLWLRVGDAQVAAELQLIPAFKDDGGNFSRALYEQRTRLLGYSELTFEERMRDELARSQLYAGVGGSEIVADNELKMIHRLVEQERDIGYAIVPGSGYENTINIGEDEISAYYDANSSRYRELEKVSLEYVEVSASFLASSIKFSEKELRDQYLADVSKYTIAEERDAEYILLPLSNSASEDELRKATSKLLEISELFRQGSTIEAIKDSYGQDTEFNVQASRTGFFRKGIMAQPFEDGVFGLTVGQFSEPIRTDFGLHIIKLVEIAPARIKSFEEVQSDVESSMKEVEAQKLFFEIAEEFSTLVYENPLDLATTADALDLEIKKLGFLNQEALTVLFSEQAATAIFDAEVVIENMNSVPIELPDGRLVAFRSAGYKPARVPPLVEIRSRVEEDLLTTRLRDVVARKAVELIELVNAGQPMSEVIAAEGLDWKNVVGAKRDSTDVNREIISKAFSAVADESGVVYLSVPIGMSDNAVVRVSNVEFPKADALDPESQSALGQQLKEEKAASSWATYVRGMRQQTRVEIHHERL
jgi:peptidyl-prolyl cis-trans isomerase D